MAGPETYNAFHDEDPAPSALVGQTGHLHETEGKDTGEGGGETADEVEDGIAFLDVV